MTNAIASTQKSRTQQERRETTRAKLMDAAVQSLVEVGFAKTTTLEVQRRAGVSRGALLHHYPSKGELLVATIQHLSALRGRQLSALSSDLPQGRERMDAVLGLLWASFSGPLFQVTTELRFAARTDHDLRQALIAAEGDLWSRVHSQARALFGEEVSSRAGFEQALDATIHLMVGAASTEMLHGKRDGRMDTVINYWQGVFPTLLHTHNTN